MNQNMRKQHYDMCTQWTPRSAWTSHYLVIVFTVSKTVEKDRYMYASPRGNRNTLITLGNFKGDLNFPLTHEFSISAHAMCRGWWALAHINKVSISFAITYIGIISGEGGPVQSVSSALCFLTCSFHLICCCCFDWNCFKPMRELQNHTNKD